MQRLSLEASFFFNAPIHLLPFFRFSETHLSWTQKRLLQELNIEEWVSGVTAKPQGDLGSRHLLLKHVLCRCIFCIHGEFK